MFLVKALLNASRSTCFCAKHCLMRRDQHTFAQNIAYCVEISRVLVKANKKGNLKGTLEVILDDHLAGGTIRN